jgi:hypothetical protein
MAHPLAAQPFYTLRWTDRNSRLPATKRGRNGITLAAQAFNRGPHPVLGRK